MVEVMSEKKEYIPLKDQEDDEINNIFDYYEKVEPLKNPVYKIHFDFFFYMNGVRLRNPDVALTPHDCL